MLLVLLQVLEVHHAVLWLLLAGEAKIILILHRHVAQGVSLWIEGLDLVHVGGHRVGVVGASSEVHVSLARLRIVDWVGVGEISAVVAIHGAEMMGWEAVGLIAVLARRLRLEESCLRAGLVVELRVELQLTHLSLESFVFLRHVLLLPQQLLLLECALVQVVHLLLALTELVLHDHLLLDAVDILLAHVHVGVEAVVLTMEQHLVLLLVLLSVH